jgi:cytochrome c-type biogenesis protein CcmH
MARPQRPAAEGEAGMTRIALALALILLAAAGFAQEDPATPPTAGEGKDALQRELEHEIMAPCCYGSPVGDHDSEAARQVKGQIARYLAEDKTKAEIIDLFVATYGEQILARPRARGFNLLAYLMPPVILLAGGLPLVYFINRIRTPIAPKAPTVSDSDSARLLEKIEREMRELDI